MNRDILLFFIFLLGLGCGAHNEVAARGNTPDGSADKPFFFIQMTDPQLGFATGSKDFEAETRNMERAIDVVNRLRPDFVVITGDFVNNYNSTAQLNEFHRLLGLFDSSIPVYLVPGNHDIDKIETGDEIKPYICRYGYDRFSFSHEGCRFIGVNSNIIKDGFAPLLGEQDIWLERELQDARMAAHTFVFMHCPMFARSFEERETYSNLSMADRNKYMALFVEHGVDAVMAGHLHNNFSVEAEGIRVITTGPVSKPLGEGGFSGMNLVKVWPERFTSEFIALDQFPDSVEF